jgi:hypothetical protein
VCNWLIVDLRRTAMTWMDRSHLNIDFRLERLDVCVCVLGVDQLCEQRRPIVTRIKTDNEANNECVKSFDCW